MTSFLFCFTKCITGGYKLFKGKHGICIYSYMRTKRLMHTACFNICVTVNGKWKVESLE